MPMKPPVTLTVGVKRSSRTSRVRGTRYLCFFDDKVAPLNISWSRKAGSCRATGVDLRGAHVVWPRPRPYREPPGAAFPARVSRPRPQPPTTTSTSSPERWAERGRRTRSGRLREGCGDRRWPEREAGEGLRSSSFGDPAIPVEPWLYRPALRRVCPLEGRAPTD